MASSARICGRGMRNGGRTCSPTLVPADKRGGSHSRGALNIYRLRDEPRSIIMVACTVRLEGVVQPRRTDRLARCRLPTAEPTGSYRCAGLSSARLQLGPLRRALRRADRGAAMTTLTMRMIKGDFVVTGPRRRIHEVQDPAKPRTGACHGP